MLNSLRIVLVNTSHPGNIGATARAMKTMGLHRLYLVAPKRFPNAQATEMASSADDILAQAMVVDELAEAIADCQWVVGASARSRDLSLPVLSPRDCGAQAVREMDNGCQQMAVVFGNEQSGLSNAELHYCHAQVVIPSNPEYSSLNLAAAVQIMCYELRMASQIKGCTQPTKPIAYATAAEMEQFYQHLATVLIDIGFLQPTHPKQLMPRLKRLFNRARLQTMELNILRGILSSVQKANK